MVLKLYTAFHVVISLLGILAGFVVMVGMITASPLDRWTSLFLITTIATSVTGFFFPATRLTPAHVVGAQYLNVFVLVVQMFQKIPSLKLLAPTQNERPFQLAQAAVLVGFVVWGIFAGLRFHV